MQTSPEDALLWHDLGLSTYLQAKVQEIAKEEAATRDLLNRSVQAIKKGLTLDPSNAQMWSTLGIVTSHKCKIRQLPYTSISWI